jgi:hypothetical protein
VSFIRVKAVLLELVVAFLAQESIKPTAFDADDSTDCADRRGDGVEC